MVSAQRDFVQLHGQKILTGTHPIAVGIFAKAYVMSRSVQTVVLQNLKINISSKLASAVVHTTIRHGKYVLQMSALNMALANFAGTCQIQFKTFAIYFSLTILDHTATLQRPAY